MEITKDEFEKNAKKMKDEQGENILCFRKGNTLYVRPINPESKKYKLPEHLKDYNNSAIHVLDENGHHVVIGALKINSK